MSKHSLDNPKVAAAYMNAPEHVKSDLVEAAIWARDTLRDKEGSGHNFQIHAEKNGMLTCSFAKAEWSADHCGDEMEEASSAIVLAVCEYLNGL